MVGRSNLVRRFFTSVRRPARRSVMYRISLDRKVSSTLSNSLIGLVEI